jgi:hypothetical protein
MVSLRLDQLRLDQRAWPRFGINQDRVDLFASLRFAGEIVPPVEVVPIGDGTYLVADGVHRTLAAKAANQAEIEVVILTIPDGQTAIETAFRRALETAIICALPLTSAERRRAALRLLAEQPQLSHRAVARLVGVAHDSVDRWARDVDESSTPAQDTGEPQATWTPERVDQAARRVAGTLLRLDEGRGLLDMIRPARMGRHLADAFEDRLGEDALAQARRFAQWTTAAVAVLEDRRQ